VASIARPNRCIHTLDKEAYGCIGFKRARRFVRHAEAASSGLPGTYRLKASLTGSAAYSALPGGSPRVQQVQRRVECKRLDVAAVAPQHKVGVGRPAASAAAAAAAGVRSHQHSASTAACGSVQCQQAPALPAQAPAPR